MATFTPHDQAALRTAMNRLRRATAVPVVFGGFVARGGSLRLTEFTGTLTGALGGLLVGAGSGLGGRVVATARPAAVTDYAADSRISHEYDGPVQAEGLRAIAAVPVPVAGEVAAVLYGAIREPLCLAARSLDQAYTVARDLGTELSVQREVERRLAHLEAAAERRAAGDRPEASAWEDVRCAHAELRSITQSVADAELRDRLREVCDLLAGPRAAAGPVTPLSMREVDVLAQIAQGCGNAEAGRRLGLLPETVKSYLRSAMRKLGTHTRMETVVAARRNGFLP
ncbi:helix-turn-helix transcriptional regulator [Sinosporangium siamense]|uniref:Helix-turn-helix transcriptional regulator n=1 Tax=Sinosporangium siamense TaxID=1367973 RepID=A0A919RR14_9ACTN|nr:LuxR C-terminal-related transcriptional regulator [Sinosporangium siamense]GII96654.1 helix-turn-helix transcriptional regulator [Sinosporangium siamense]